MNLFSHNTSFRKQDFAKIATTGKLFRPVNLVPVTQHVRCIRVTYQGRQNWGQGYKCPPTPYFVRSVNPIPTRGAYYAHRLQLPSPRFLDLPTALICNCRHAGSSLNTVGTNLIGGHNLPSLDRIG